ncbi:hypothetical protein LL912_11105 [Niabella sp. CC-SYL272]|uniref:hypothetical protein n=1 Tax=Niabella agricola TaxID=2891571 RepID=UPI001F15792C|nr:hypothetical protein [Niabella agricola]MCF3109329.1 hypothetical protein [Niabella agricola]
MHLYCKLRLLNLFCLILFTGFSQPAVKTSVTGSWKYTKGNESWIFMAADQYCMVTHYDASGKKFFKTFGGFQHVEQGVLRLHYRFHSDDKSKTGSTGTFVWNAKNGYIESDLSGELGKWMPAGKAGSAMAGVWRITKRKEGNDLRAIQLAPRRTLKLLTDDRFQWAAINTETGEFSGTGGGTYAFRNGVYTETITFFSRDSSRVGMTLQFKDHLEEGHWIHTGLSSKGDPIYEVWSKTTPDER